MRWRQIKGGHNEQGTGGGKKKLAGKKEPRGETVMQLDEHKASVSALYVCVCERERERKRESEKRERE